MKKFLQILFVLALIIFACEPALYADDNSDKYIVLEVEGKGKDRESAIEAAWLEGIRQAVGSFIDSKTELNNDKLTERIISYSRGLVEKYEIISVDESKADRGIYALKMRLWIVQTLIRDGVQHASSNSAEIAFSPAELLRRQREELDAKAAKELEAKNAAEETAKKKSQTGAELLKAMLARYKPLDFLTCYIPGVPEPVKDKQDTFTLKVELNFNDKLYKEKFIPDLIQVLDQIAAQSKNTMLVKYKQELRDLAAKKDVASDKTSVISKVFEAEKNYTLAVYNRPERFGVRLYKFNADEAENINKALQSFSSRIRKIRGILLELIDEDKEVIETIENKLNLKLLLSNGNNTNTWVVHPTIINSANGTENTRVVVPITLEMPEEIIPFVKNLKASLIANNNNVREPGWLGLEPRRNNVSGSIYVTYNTPMNTPAIRAGIRRGDDIISLNNIPIKTVEDAEEIIGNLYVGDIVTIKVKRSGKNLTYEVELEEKPEANTSD